MCGITGVFLKKEKFCSIRFAKANNIIKHRGPDDFGYATIDKQLSVNEYFDENLKDYNAQSNTIGAFGFRRLSIIDISKKGHQPMTDTEKKIWIIFNGEIYNHIELKKELIELGYKFNSRTDTEVILNSYKEWGEDCVLKFNGMWSFSVLDIKKKKLFCSRDRLGIKPFYYLNTDKFFIFSSEIKQILEYNKDKAEANDKLLFDYLAFGAYGNHCNETYFKNILKLGAGNSLIYDIEKKKIKIKKYWDLEDTKKVEKATENNIFKKIRDLLTDSVKLRLRSDVPIGTALSGGLDSSGLVCLIDKINPDNNFKNNVFTVTSDDKKIDDPYYARLVKKEVETNSFETNFSEEHKIEDLYKFIYHQEEPLQSSSIFGSWYLYNFIKDNGITVNLDGQGADELMGGYYRLPFQRYFAQLINDKKIKLYFKQLKKVSQVYSVSYLYLFYQSIKTLFFNFIKSRTHIFYKYKIYSIRAYINKEFEKNNFKLSPLIEVNRYYQQKNLKNKLKEDSLKLVKHTNLTGILRQVDRNSMAASVEARVPFLDHRLVEYLYSIPYNLMIRDGYSKFAYRMAMKNIIPEKVLWRKGKEGFKMPEYEILKQNKSFVINLLENNNEDKNIEVINIKKLLLKSIENKKYYNNIIWRAVTYLVWKEKFLKNEH